MHTAKTLLASGLLFNASHLVGPGVLVRLQQHAHGNLYLLMYEGS